MWMQGGGRCDLNAVQPLESSDPTPGDPHHVLAASGVSDDRPRVLKHGDTFAVFDHFITLDERPRGTLSMMSSRARSVPSRAPLNYGDGLGTLVQENGPVLVGRVSWADPGNITFRIDGEGPDDPGLRFIR
jgi:hypothetical protein